MFNLSDESSNPSCEIVVSIFLFLISEFEYVINKIIIIESMKVKILKNLNLDKKTIINNVLMNVKPKAVRSPAIYTTTSTNIKSKHIEI